jgi:hypothetical protein
MPTGQSATRHTPLSADTARRRGSTYPGHYQSWPASMAAMVKRPIGEDPVAGGPPYRRMTALLKRAGWQVGKDRVERISTPRTKTCPRGPRSGVVAKG